MDRAFPTVLLIDNDEELVEAVRARLASEGMRCLTAYTGAQGVSLFDEGDVDVVITDLNMPEGDGVAVARTIRARSRVPIIVVTGFRDEYNASIASIPNVSIIRKPFESEELVQLVSIAVELGAGNAVPGIGGANA